MVRIALGDRQILFRQGLKRMLIDHPDFEVVSETGDGHELVRATPEARPEIVLMDVTMNNLDGPEAARLIRARCPDTRVIALSSYTDRRSVVGMLTAGASGYVTKDCCFDELAGAIRAVAAGRTFLSASISDIVINDHFHSAENGSIQAAVPLSHRERQVLQLLALGCSSKEIADKCAISLKTVATYRLRLMRKLDVNSLAGLIKYAVHEELGK